MSCYSVWAFVIVEHVEGLTATYIRKHLRQLIHVYDGYSCLICSNNTSSFIFTLERQLFFSEELVWFAVLFFCDFFYSFQVLF